MDCERAKTRHILRLQLGLTKWRTKVTKDGEIFSFSSSLDTSKSAAVFRAEGYTNEQVDRHISLAFLAHTRM